MHIPHNGYVSPNRRFLKFKRISSSVRLTINRFFWRFLFFRYFPNIAYSSAILFLPSFSDDTQSQSHKEEGPSRLSLQATTHFLVSITCGNLEPKKVIVAMTMSHVEPWTRLFSWVAIDRETRITVKTKKMKLQCNCPTAGTLRNERKHLKMLSTSFLLMLIEESKARMQTAMKPRERSAGWCNPFPVRYVQLPVTNK